METVTKIVVHSFFFIFLLFYIFIYFWLRWVFVAVRRLLIAWLHCGGFSCCGALALGAWASVVAAIRLQSAGSVVVVQGLSCSAACGIFPDQGSNPCPLHWQADLRHQGSPFSTFFRLKICINIKFPESDNLYCGCIRDAIRE